ncbi:MAG: discoidin domain-containing protein [Elusimicrobiota bacterium]
MSKIHQSISWLIIPVILMLGYTCAYSISVSSITVSSEQDGNPEYAAEHAVDGDMGTRWASDHADNQWMRLDVGALESFDRIKIFWEAGYTKEYEISVSTDDSNWTAVYGENNGDGGEDEISLTDQKARYIRINMIKRGTIWGNSIYEVQISSNSTADAVATASDSESAEFAPAKAIDGDMKTRWASLPQDSSWLQIDFAKQIKIDGIKLFWELAYTKKYDIRVSTNGVDWKTIFSENNGDGDQDTIAFSTETARYIRIVTIERGTAWGNSLYEFIATYDGEPVIDRDYELFVDVNQGFYGSKAAKTAVVRYGKKAENGTYEITDTHNNIVLSGNLTYWGKRWEMHFWTIDFSGLETEGEYTVKAEFGGKSGESEICVSDAKITGAIEKTMFYFYTQRCGMEIPGWHKCCHLDDAKRPDGSHINGVGGWHDCAGFDKEMYTNYLPVYVYTTIAFESDLPWKVRMLEEAKWGADWVINMTEESGYVWCHVDPNFPPDFAATWQNGTDTDNIPGTEDDRKLKQNDWHPPEEGPQASNMGALLKLAYLIKNEDTWYSDKCIDAAKKIRAYLKGKNADNSPNLIVQTGLLLGDIYLYKLENNTEYLTDARKRIDHIIDDCQVAEGEFIYASTSTTTMSEETIEPYFNLLVLYEFVKNFPNDSYCAKVKNSYKSFMDNQLMKRVNKTPYGQAQVLDKAITDYSQYESYQRDFEVPTVTYSQGKNPYWLSMAIACFNANKLFDTDEYTAIAVNQIDWVLGKNPLGLSTVADIGYNFPKMFTMWIWLTDHPGSEGVIPGGVINGIGGDKNDMPYMDMSTGNVLTWETNEYWNPPTAWFAMAAWEYYALLHPAASDTDQDTSDDVSITTNLDDSVNTTITLTLARGDVVVDVPAGAFGRNVTLTISTATVPASGNRTIKVTDIGIEIIKDTVYQPVKKITITVYYRDSDITGLDESKLALARYDAVYKCWMPITSVVYPDQNKVVGTTDHLSKFAVVQLTSATDLAAVKVYPNPFNPANGALVIDGLTENADIRIFTITGELVREVSYTSANGRTSWDGRNDSGNTVGSGIYLAHVKNNSGEKTVKIAVVK